MLERVKDWPDQLAAIERTLDREPWRWGRHDCATAMLRVLEAITGDSELRAKYRRALSKRDRERVRPVEMLDYTDAEADELQLERVPAELLHRGDPCLVRSPGRRRRLSLAFISTRGTPAVADEIGLLELPRDAVLHGWRIPCPR